MAKTKIQKELLREIAGAKDDITFPTLSGVYRNLDPTVLLQGGTKGVHLYDDLLTDGHTEGVVMKRILAVLAHKWSVTPASDALRDRKAAEEITRQLTNMPFTRVRLDMLLSMVWGFTVHEAMYRREADKVVCYDLFARDQFRFYMDPDYKIRLRTTENLMPGEPVPEGKFIWHTFGSRNRNPYGRALGESTWFWIFFKRKIVEMWLQYADRFSSPFVVVTTPPNTSDEAREAALQMANEVSRDTGIQIPDGFKIELLESKRNASVDVFETLAQRCDEEISMAVLGESVTTGSGERASRAAVAEYSNSFLALVRFDAEYLCETLNTTLIPTLTAYNFPGANPPKLSIDVEDPAELGRWSQIVIALANVGIRPTLENVMKKLGDEWEYFDASPGNNANNHALKSADKSVSKAADQGQNQSQGGSQ